MAYPKIVKLVYKRIKRLYEDLVFNLIQKKLVSFNATNSDRVFIFSTPRHLYYENLYLLISHELARRNFPSCFLFDNGKHSPDSPELIVDKLVLNKSIYTIELRKKFDCKKYNPPTFDREIDLPGGVAKIDGINFFYEIQCSMQRIYKSYTLDFDDETIVATAHEMIESCSLLLDIYRKIHQYANKENQKIIFCGWETTYLPNSIFNKLCSESTQKYVHYVALDRGYMHYFGKERNASNIAMANLTKEKVVSRLSITRQELDSYSLSVADQEIADHSIIKALKESENRIVNNLQQTKSEVMRTISKFGHNRKIFVLFAHLFYDAPVLDKSDAFQDMQEWIIETIKYFQKSEHLLLLKPHPLEINPFKPQIEPNQRLIDLVKPYLGKENIQLLHPLLFGTKDLISFLDCGLVWRSSVALELTYLQVPTIIAGVPPYQTLDLCYAQSREHYFELIESSEKIKITEKQKNDVIYYLSYFEHNKHIYIKQLKRTGNWDFLWMSKHLLSRDKNVELLVDQLLEKTEN